MTKQNTYRPYTDIHVGVRPICLLLGHVLVPARSVEWYRGGLVFKAHRLLYHSTPGSRVNDKKKKSY